MTVACMTVAGSLTVWVAGRGCREGVRGGRAEGDRYFPVDRLVSSHRSGSGRRVRR